MFKSYIKYDKDDALLCTTHGSVPYVAGSGWVGSSVKNI